jgi:hypothetical protein
MKTVEDINLLTYFGERELSFSPKHFVVSNTPLTDESRNWIVEKLTGRYAFVYKRDNETMIHSERVCPSFEDPKEAIIYELTWS